MICNYCLNPRKDLDGWHGCDQSLDAKARIDQEIDEIAAMMSKPGSRELTSMDMKNREDRRRQMATGLRINGQEVRPEYEVLDARD